LERHGPTLPFPYSSQVEGKLRRGRSGGNEFEIVGGTTMNRLQRYYEKQMQDETVRLLVEEEIDSLDLGIQIAKLREKQNLNQTQLAARAGMNASKISKIETSTTNLTLSTLTRVATALNSRVKIVFVPLKKHKVFMLSRKKKVVFQANR
jgi:DNA-binding Xre family transcriptional regulator